MDNIWIKVFRKTHRPTREEVDAVQAREVAEATRQRLEDAIRERRAEQINGLVRGVIPRRGQT